MITKKVFVYAYYSEYSKTFDLTVQAGDFMADTWILLEEKEIEVELPAHEVLVAAWVKVLRAEKAKILADASVKAQSVEESIQKLLCIEDHSQQGSDDVPF